MLTVISGGQTGADRAALEAAIATATPYGGWCPKGGWAEDLPQPPGLLVLYPNLRETPSSEPDQRTDWNVRDSAALLVLVGQGGLAVSKGSQRAVRYAERLGRPAAIVDVTEPDAARQALVFLKPFRGDQICIAGPRESEVPGLQAKARSMLEFVLTEMAKGG